MFENMYWLQLIIVLGGYIVLLLTSGVVVTGVLQSISKEQILKIGKDARDTGFVVGKCENILILTFMLLEGYTALALIFAAKAVVRREDMSKNSLFYLAGTMINVTYSIIIGALMIVLLR